MLARGMTRAQHAAGLAVLRRAKIAPPSRRAEDVGTVLAELMHGLRGQGLSRDKIAAHLHTSFPLVRWVFSAYPYAPDLEPIPCVCGCGRTFMPRNGRRYYDSRWCRDRYLANGGEPLGLKKNIRRQPADATGKQRREYCHQLLPGDIWRTRCQTHVETCGGGCLRLDDNGRPCCFVPGGPSIETIRTGVMDAV